MAETGVGREQSPVGQGATVSQQMVRGNGLGVRGVRVIEPQPRQVVADRFVEIQLSLVLQLHETQAEERLADGADVEQAVRVERDAALQVFHAVSANPLNSTVVGQCQREARGIHVAQVLLHVAVEQRESRSVAAGTGRERFLDGEHGG